MKKTNDKNHRTQKMKKKYIRHTIIKDKRLKMKSIDDEYEDWTSSKYQLK
jgi:hypothetical protein